MENSIFEGIPTLDDTKGLQNFVNNEALGQLGIPAASVQDPAQGATGNQDPVPQPAQPTVQTAPAIPQTPVQAQPQPQPQTPMYTREQVQQILQTAQSRQAPAVQNTQPYAPSGTYTPQQQATIKALIDRGVPLERIIAAMNGDSSKDRAQQAILQRLQGLEQYLQNQQYIAAQNEFINKMQDFGDKFGLSENDLVTFGNKALSMGINLTEVNDVEAVFRAVYPEQYAIRAQRISGNAGAPIIGGASAGETPRAQNTKLEDAYVDAFLKRAMPNQYGIHTK